MAISTVLFTSLMLWSNHQSPNLDTWGPIRGSVCAHQTVSTWRNQNLKTWVYRHTHGKLSANDRKDLTNSQTKTKMNVCHPIWKWCKSAFQHWCSKERLFLGFKYPTASACLQCGGDNLLRSTFCFRKDIYIF